MNRNAEYEPEENNDNDNGIDCDGEESSPEKDNAVEEDSSDTSGDELDWSVSLLYTKTQVAFSKC